MSLMTQEEKRAFFAGMAMHAFLSRADFSDLDRKDLARDAWGIADAMMSEEVEDKDSPLYVKPVEPISREPKPGLREALRRAEAGEVMAKGFAHDLNVLKEK